ncbi:integrase core domain-containing protein, partial [Comamonas thiooxydans]|uniref:integrase core domain-containing protein n=1 Tax=Comamonas thiooxydans TaxID=363952 RepID=UPI0013F47280
MHFNWTCRTEVLDCHVFESLQEVRSMTVGWLHRYKHHRPHESPGRIPPAGYRVKRFPRPRLLGGAGKRGDVTDLPGRRLDRRIQGSPQFLGDGHHVLPEVPPEMT